MSHFPPRLGVPNQMMGLGKYSTYIYVCTYVGMYSMRFPCSLAYLARVCPPMILHRRFHLLLHACAGSFLAFLLEGSGGLLRHLQAAAAGNTGYGAYGSVGVVVWGSRRAWLLS